MAPGSMSQVQLTFAPVVKRVAPGVVNVYSRTVVQQQANPFFNDPLFSQLFGSPEMRQRVQQSLGSGVIVRADGLILTNNHVVAGGTDTVVALSDKREFKAKILLADPRTDLAVLKIDTKGERLPVVPFGDSDAVQVGDSGCWRSAINSASWPDRDHGHCFGIACNAGGTASDYQLKLHPDRRRHQSRGTGGKLVNHRRQAGRASTPRSIRAAAARSASASPFRQTWRGASWRASRVA